eukprot:gene2044-1550_t
MIKSFKGIRKPVEKNIQKFIETCAKNNRLHKRSKEELKNVASYILEGREIQYKYTPENFEDWIEKCKKELINGTVNWKRRFGYQNVLAYDKDFCKDVIELHKCIVSIRLISPPIEIPPDMNFLQYYLILSGLFEIFGVYQLHLKKNVSKVIPTGFLKSDETASKNDYVVFFTQIFLLILTMTRLHCAMDMHSKSIYRLTLWIHILEALLLVGLPAVKKELSSKGYPISAAIVMLPIWMTYSYKAYLY